MRLMRIRRHLVELAAVLLLVALAIPISAYILDHQRLRWPWENLTTLEAEFRNAQAVAPGQGQTVTVAGVEVGEIKKVETEDGVAVVTVELEPGEVGPVYRNATMYLRPKTGLNDMTIQLDPGHPDPRLEDGGRLGDGDRLEVAQTTTNVNPDEVLAHLDMDTRRYLAIVANAGGQGLNRRGPDLRALLAASQPTLERSARVGRALADRRTKLRRLVHNLRVLSRAAAAKDGELASLVEASSDVLETVGARESELAAGVERLPGALRSTRVALHEGRALAEELRPAAEELRPLVRELAPAMVEVRPLLRDAEPILREDLRPLVREATPLLAELRPSVDDLNESAPPLVRTGKVLNYVANELGHNPPGREEGYLFWTAWFVHNANSILTTEDAHGATWRGLAMVGCSTFGELLGSNPALAPLAAVPVCPEEPPPATGRRRR
ncbi:MAG: phospholipid/cholesterol/gamma-HCH transport system substrate-binding protein [Thermoleophilaceae bacterium]|nr:phospholipid/cholesterol/gamma-HCH transport system substrate-binding protein [Thermoleophilaceae bacterium]